MNPRSYQFYNDGPLLIGLCWFITTICSELVDMLILGSNLIQNNIMDDWSCIFHDSMILDKTARWMLRDATSLNHNACLPQRQSWTRIKSQDPMASLGPTLRTYLDVVLVASKDWKHHDSAKKEHDRR